jgi:UDP-2,3-diacylglucosamine hydrolase
MQAIEGKPAVSLGPGDRVAIIAGSGRLPVNVADGLKAAGQSPYIVIAGGERTDVTELTMHDHAVVELERLPETIPLLKRHGVTHVVLAGGVGRRPRVSRMRPSWALLRVLVRLAPALAKGDNALLATIVRVLEDHGFKVVGAHEVVPDLLAEEGVATRAVPTAADRRDLEAALTAAKAIGALDIGQAAVAIGGRVVAVEDIEGTDGLLARVKTLRKHPRLAARERGVIVKCAKPGQELRADLPSIGPQTVSAASEAGLAGIGIEAGRSLVLDHAEVVSLADRLGLFVVGLPGARA